MEKMTLTTVQNPFRPSDRRITHAPHMPGASLGHYVEQMGLEPGAEYRVAISGKVIPKELWHAYTPGEYDWITAVPVVHGGDGKNPLALIASLLVPIVAMGIGSVVAGGAFLGEGFIGPTSWGWSSMFAAAATMALGGYLVQALAGTPSLDLGDSMSETAYRWGPMQSLQGQGYPVPILYGTTRTAGQIIAEHVTTDGDTQYYNVLICVAEGPIDSITDVKINDNPIDNYSDVEEYTRLGTNDQTVIPGFGDTYADQSLTYVLDMADPEEAPDVRESRCDTCDHWHFRRCTFKQATAILKDDGSGRVYHPSRSTNPAGLCDDYVITTTGDKMQQDTGEAWSTHQTEGDSGEGLEVVLDFSHGLYYANDQGDQEETHVDVVVQYRAVGAPEWIPWIDERVQRKETSAFQQVYRLDNLPAARYEVRARVAAKQGTTLRYANAVKWTMLSHIIYDDFTRPGKALLAVRAMATDQLSGGRPNITALVTRSTVQVFNPGADAYEEKPADNPAWACYDLIHRCRKILDARTSEYVYVAAGAPVGSMVYADFAAWADFCTGKNLKVNHVMQEAKDLWGALKLYEAPGRGKAILRGTKWSCVWDGLSDPVQLFSVGNVLKDSFQEEFLGLKDRANAIEITFLNAAKGYQRDTLTVYDADFDNPDTIENPAQVTLDAVTSWDQAYREGMYRLALNRYILRTCTWTADVDAIACQVGDVVRLQHDVPQWGWGGRIVSVASQTDPAADVLTLDREVTLEPGTDYAVMVRAADDTLMEKSLAAVAETTVTDAVVLAGYLDGVGPSDLAGMEVYSLGPVNHVGKDFRIARITRESDLTVRLVALEYVPEVYAETTVPSEPETVAAQAVTSLTVSEHVDAQGQVQLDISWTPPREGYYGAAVKVNRRQVARVGQTESSFTMPCPNGVSVVVEVAVLNALGHPTATKEEDYAIEARTVPVVPYVGLAEESRVLADGTALSDVRVTWTRPDSAEIRHFVIRYKVDTGAYQYAGISTDEAFTLSAVPVPSTVSVSVAVVNSAGVAGDPVESSPVAVGGKDTPAPDITGLTYAVDPLDKGRVILSWDELTADVFPDLRGYIVRVGVDWDTGIQVGPVLTEPSLALDYDDSGSWTYHVRAVDTSGNMSDAAAYTVVAVAVDPADVATLTMEANYPARTDVDITWSEVDERDVVGYELRFGDSWASPVETIQVGLVTGITKYAVPYPVLEHFFSKDSNTGETITLWIAAKNKRGVYSGNPKSATIDISQTPTDPTVSSVYLEPVHLQWVEPAPGGECDSYQLHLVLSMVEETDVFGFAFQENSESVGVWIRDPANLKGGILYMSEFVREQDPEMIADGAYRILGPEGFYGCDAKVRVISKFPNAEEIKANNTFWYIHPELFDALASPGVPVIRLKGE